MRRIPAKKASAFFCAFLPSLCVYGITLRPEIDWGDSAELSVQAYQLGVTHAPGYPVHSILGKALNFVVSEPALATNLLSALCASLAAGLMSAMILDLTENLWAPLFVPWVFALSPSFPRRSNAQPAVT